MKKNRSLRKALITGGMAVALLAPMALSTITPTNVMPSTITVQAKRRHHRHHHSYKIAISAKRARRMKRKEIRRIKRELRHTHKHSFWHEVLEAKLHRVRRTKAFAIYRR